MKKTHKNKPGTHKEGLMTKSPDIQHTSGETAPEFAPAHTVTLEAYCARCMKQIIEYRTSRNQDAPDADEEGKWQKVFRSEHKQEVRFALADGKEVPAEVLADYPDITPFRSDLPDTRYAGSIFEGNHHE